MATSPAGKRVRPYLESTWALQCLICERSSSDCPLGSWSNFASSLPRAGPADPSTMSYGNTLGIDLGPLRMFWPTRVCFGDCRHSGEDTLFASVRTSHEACAARCVARGCEMLLARIVGLCPGPARLIWALRCSSCFQNAHSPFHHFLDRSRQDSIPTKEWEDQWREIVSLKFNRSSLV